MAMGLWAARLAIYTQTAAAIPVAWAAWRLVAAAAELRPGRRLAQRIGIVTVAMFGYALPTMALAVVVDPPTPDDNVACGTARVSDAIDDEAPSGDVAVLAHLDTSMLIHYLTDADVVATGHHRNVDGMRAVRATFRATPDDARREVERRGVDFIAVCDALDDSYIEPAPPGSLFRALADGTPPPWLEEIPLESGDSRLYRVLPQG
jgi:hypothetical protein